MKQDDRTLARLYFALAAQGLDPVADPAVGRCLSHCPACNASRSDTAGIWRCLASYLDGTTVCSGNGCTAAAIKDATTGPSDHHCEWRTIALGAQDVATDALLLADRAIERHLATVPPAKPVPGRHLDTVAA